MLNFKDDVIALLDTIYTVQYWINGGISAPRCENPAKLSLAEATEKGWYPYDVDDMPVRLQTGKLWVNKPYTRGTLIIDAVLVDSIIDDIATYALHWQMLCLRHYDKPEVFSTLDPRYKGESRRAFLLRAQAWCQEYLMKLAGLASGGSPNLAERMSGEARALAVLAKHPEYTHAQVAKAAGLHVKTLYKYQQYMTAREVLKDAGKTGLPRGYKTKAGDIEAFE